MPPKSSIPLRRTNLNLFEEDCREMERRYGRGWTERVRDLVHQRLRKIRADEAQVLYEDREMQG